MKSLFTAVVGLSLAVRSASGAVEVVSDHSDAMYRCGETAVLAVRLTDGAGHAMSTGRVSVVVDDFGSHRQLERDFDLASANPFAVSGSLSAPGFLRLTLRGAGVKGTFTWSAGYEPDRIRPVTERPADLDEFWAEARARLAREVPLDARMDRVAERSAAAFDFYRISFATFGRRVYGYMSVPTDSSRKPYPVSVGIAAGGFGDWTNDLAGRPDRICVFFSVYPFEPDWRWREKGLRRKFEEMNRDLAARFGTSYAAAGAGVSREAYFYYPVILGIDRALDWIAARPDVDRRDFAYQGASQGGGLGLVLTGLNRRITRASFYLPSLTDMLAGRAGLQCGCTRLVEEQQTAEAKETAKRTLPYFDGAAFAARITCPVRFAVGLSDTTCTPHCTWGAFNAVASKDKMLLYGIGLGHDFRNGFYDALGAWTCGSEVQFRRRLDELRALEREGFVRIRPFAPAQDE